MIWKIVAVFLNIAVCVQGTEDAISEQKVIIHHEKRSGLSEVGPKKNQHQDDKSWAYPSYEFSYKVNDPETHDMKGQHEIREGDEVTGNYWLIEPDGKKRTVNYQANDNNGFNAEIDYTASVKTEERGKDIGGTSQDKNNENKEDNLETEKDDNIESDVGEAIPNNENDNDVNINSDNQPGIEENNLNEQSKSDNLEDGEENISNIVSENVNESESRTTVEYEVCCTNNSNNNQQRNSGGISIVSYRRNRAHNSPKKDKPEKNQKNNGQIHILSNANESNKNNHNKHRNERRVKQESRKVKGNNINRNSNKRQQSKRDKNLISPENSDNGGYDSTKNPKQMNQDQKGKTESRSTNEESISYKKTNLYVEPNSQRKIDRTKISNSREVYEHTIHIRHPKIIS